MKTMYIYKITNKINGKTYIGQRHCPENKTPWTDTKYMGSGIHLKRSQNKYGINNFSKEIIAICHDLDVLNILEFEYIKLYKEIGKAEYNHNAGGNHPIPDDVTRKKLSNSIRNSEKYRNSLKSKERSAKLSYAAKHRSEETLYKIGSANRGKKISEEIRNKQSYSQRNSLKKKIVMQSSEYKEKCRIKKLGENNPMFGKHISEEHKRILSEVNSGRMVSDETRLKLSKALKGRKQTEEQRRINSECHKGFKHSEESKKKMSLIHKAMVTDEFRKLMSNVHKGVKKSEETKKKMSESAKRRWNEKTLRELSDSIKNSEKYKAAMEARKGEHYYNNGVIIVRCKECPVGFVPGRVIKK